VKKPTTTKNTASTGLNDRAQVLLRVLIEKYINEGTPVGSKALARDSGLQLSPATIRNVLAELENAGLIRSPHTSAGRVPTDRGYRLFVDSMVQVQPLQQNLIETLKIQLTRDQNSNDVVASATDVLSEATQMASIVMLPRRDQQAFRQIEFLPLSDKRILAITIINECEVENRILHVERAYSQDELLRVSNFLNAAFAGRDVNSVRTNLVEELQKARQDVYEFMGQVVDMAERLFPEKAATDLMVKGEANLLSFGETTDMEKLKLLFEAFRHKRDILELLDQSMAAQCMQIYIGAETGRQVLQDYSVVTSPYEVDGQIAGVLGVVGPTRMQYERVIPMVDITAKLLGSALQFQK